jgi:hypothetical protein
MFRLRKQATVSMSLSLADTESWTPGGRRAIRVWERVDAPHIGHGARDFGDSSIEIR